MRVITIIANFDNSGQIKGGIEIRVLFARRRGEIRYQVLPLVTTGFTLTLTKYL